MVNTADVEVEEMDAEERKRRLQKRRHTGGNA